MQQSRRTAADTADRLVTIGQDYDDIKSQIDAARAAADEVRARIQYTRQSATNNVLAYGPKTPQFLQAINSDRGWRDKPIGPIGQYVKLDHQQYGGVLESFFAQILNAYICTNHEDSARLKRIHRQCQLCARVPLLPRRFSERG